MNNPSRKQHPTLLQSFFYKGLAALLVWCLAAPQLIDARVQPTHGFDLFSAQEEVQAGQQASAEANKQLPLLSESDPVTQYIKRLGANLASHAQPNPIFAVWKNSIRLASPSAVCWVQNITIPDSTSLAHPASTSRCTAPESA